MLHRRQIGKFLFVAPYPPTQTRREFEPLCFQSNDILCQSVYYYCSYKIMHAYSQNMYAPPSLRSTFSRYLLNAYIVYTKWKKWDHSGPCDISNSSKYTIYKTIINTDEMWVECYYTLNPTTLSVMKWEKSAPTL